MLQLVHSTPFLKLYHSPEESLGMLTWIGFVPSDEFREGLEYALEYFKENPVSYWLGDNRNMKTIRLADQEWASNDYLPRFCQQLPLRKMAVLVSDDFFNKMAVEGMLSKGSEHMLFELQYFSRESAALHWLRK